MSGNNDCHEVIEQRMNCDWGPARKKEVEDNTRKNYSAPEMRRLGVLSALIRGTGGSPVDGDTPEGAII